MASQDDRDDRAEWDDIVDIYDHESSGERSSTDGRGVHGHTANRFDGGECFGDGLRRRVDDDSADRDSAHRLHDRGKQPMPVQRNCNGSGFRSVLEYDWQCDFNEWRHWQHGHRQLVRG